METAEVHTFAKAAGGGESSGTGTGIGGLGATGAIILLAPFVSAGMMTGTGAACALTVQRLACHIRLFPARYQV